MSQPPPEFGPLVLQTEDLLIEGVGLVLCPYCGFDYVHNKSSWILAGNDNYEAKPSKVKGDVNALPFVGECGHNFLICFGFHKGQTLCWVQGIPTPPKTKPN